MVPDNEQENYELFRDALSSTLVQNIALNTPKERRRAKGRQKNDKRRDTVAEKTKGSRSENAEDNSAHNDAEDLAEFIDYLSSEIFPSLPSTLRTLSYANIQDEPSLSETYSVPLTLTDTENLLITLPPSVSESLSTYALIPNIDSLPNLLAPVLESYITTASTPPPLDRTSVAQASECEICGREHVGLSYHHLIPRSVHAKVLKRGWHKEWELSKVAWLCRACHSFVHKIESNESLAREWFTIERLAERDDVKKWVQWVGRVRWKAR
ncbi:Bifunctional cytochrome P450/NADPH reductase [Venturia nashicola]|nr:Bifunctional cytochrome P450/NADPH reductase [Venturia nashicola]